MGVVFNDPFITFEPETHQYFDQFGDEYKSVSRVLNAHAVPFDKDGVSMAMAKQAASSSGNTIKQEQQKLLGQWKAKADSSIERGNFIHNGLEEFALTGKVEDPNLKKVSEQLTPILQSGYRYYPEQISFVQDYLVAGQADLVIQRQKKEDSVIDIYDYKTNESKGIQYDSVRRKDGKVTHYNKFFLPPIDHLEDCNYNRYVLQLSMYACMFQLTYNAKIGKLAILFIDLDHKLHEIPVPYMKYEAIELLKSNTKLKKLPEHGKELKHDNERSEAKAGGTVFSEDW